MTFCDNRATVGEENEMQNSELYQIKGVNYVMDLHSADIAFVRGAIDGTFYVRKHRWGPMNEKPMTAKTCEKGIQHWAETAPVARRINVYVEVWS